jgi:hypothetical protein
LEERFERETALGEVPPFDDVACLLTPAASTDSGDPRSSAQPIFRTPQSQAKCRCVGHCHLDAGRLRASEAETNAKGERLIWLDARVVDRMRAPQGPGESYRDVILKLLEAR